MKLVISKKNNRLPGATLEKPQKDEKLLAEYCENEETEPAKPEGWFERSIKSKQKDIEDIDLGLCKF